MPDSRKHRGPHPQDRQLFAPAAVPALQTATGDLSWLLTRGYASNSALKLVGDRYALNARQRLAVARCACGDEELRRRRGTLVEAVALAGQEVWIDGYNVLTSLEAALSGGLILHARDGCYRDLASMHGSYRRVTETIPALELLGDALVAWQVASCHWLFDAPVSNSGRLKQILIDLAARRTWNWTAELVNDPDAVLAGCDHLVASADSRILDQTASWCNLARAVIESRIAQAWVLDLSGTDDAE